MEKQLRTTIGNAAQAVRRLLEQEYAEQLDGVYDIQRSGNIAAEPGAHLTASQRITRAKVVSAIGYHHAAGLTDADAVDRFTRDAAFTTLNRFVALKMLEARQLIQEAISDSENSPGYREFNGLAPGVATLGDGAGYRLYLESLFDELASEIKVLFDRHDAASLLWPRRNAFEAMLAQLNQPELDVVWDDDETIGWFYQFFNSKEERQQMREESQAPRNSRELAVRNQFFTPRYVVQFLVDNTLGRTWIEMTDGDTSLTERCEYFVTLEDERPPRALKDPRDFKILDPACGSGHFLLYCFDLLNVMYHEAWEREIGADEATGHSLRDTYDTIEDLERAIPVLIVERNLHGVDIDPRAAQIAALAVWLRAQRAWRDTGITADNRPRIRRTGIVIAEPMPGDPELVAEFAASMQPPLLSRLFSEMVMSMSLAGEMGTLLRAEAQLADEIARARGEFVNQRVQPQTLPGFGPEVEQGELDLSGIDDDAFFIEAEERLLQALSDFVVSGAGSESARRRLFADDAAQGVALLELLRMRFDVVLMNPPFGLMPRRMYDIVSSQYPDAYYDLAVTFMERGLELARPDGLVGAITTRAFLLVTDAERFRRNRAIDAIVLLADLGSGVMDGAAVDASAQVLAPNGSDLINVIDVRTSTEKATDLIGPTASMSALQVDQASIRNLPGARIAYETLALLSHVFAKAGAGVEPEVAIARIGASTFDDERYLRARWEVDPEALGDVWMNSARSAEEFSLYYYPPRIVVKWENEGLEVCATNERVNGQVAQARQGSDHYGRPGLVFSRRSSPSICFRVHYSESSFASNTGVVLPHNDADLPLLAAVLNSTVARAAVRSLSNRDSYTVGHIKRLVWPSIDTDRSSIEAAALTLLRARRRLYSSDETDPWFSPGTTIASAPTIRGSFESWCSTLDRLAAELTEAYREVDFRLTKAFGDVPLEALADSFGVGPSDILAPQRLFAISWPQWWARAVSLAFGASYGRWRGSEATHAETEIWGPIPAPRIGQQATTDNVPPFMVNEPGHPLDVVAHVRKHVAMIWAEEPADVDESIYGATNKDLRSWIDEDFFDYHVGDYTAGKRIAPVYWQLSSPSAQTSVWLYSPSLSTDSLHRVAVDYVTPRLRQEEARLKELEEGSLDVGAAARRQLEEQRERVDDVRSFLADLEAVSALWQPSSLDGTVVGAAMLWRLFPRNRSWQRRLRETWVALAAGSLDWAETALHLWPERVAPRCAEDRSLAIAHGLLDTLWQQDARNKRKWHPRPGSDADAHRAAMGLSRPAASALERLAP